MINTVKILVTAIAFFVAIFALTFTFRLISEPDTTSNFIGFILLVLLGFGLYKVLTFKNNKKNEK